MSKAQKLLNIISEAGGPEEIQVSDLPEEIQAVLKNIKTKPGKVTKLRTGFLVWYPSINLKAKQLVAIVGYKKFDSILGGSVKNVSAVGISFKK